MAATEAGRAVDFADVYQEQLAPVWRYVRSRIPDHHEAQDVTSEAFARAWRSWPTFDPDRGDVAAWLFRISQRTVQDWIRRRGYLRPASIDQELVDSALAEPRDMPETVLLAREVLSELSHALADLTERERDGIALRFGAGLKMADVGRVLGISPGATKMLMGRSLTKLAASLDRRGHAASASASPVIDALLDQALERGQPALSTPEVRGLVLQLAVIHRPHMPSDLPRKVQGCVDCATGVVAQVRS